MKNIVPWNWIIAAFVFAFIALISIGTSRCSSHSGQGNNSSNLQKKITELQKTNAELSDSIGRISESVSYLRVKLEMKNTEVLKLQKNLNANKLGNGNGSVDNATLNSLRNKINEKDAEIRRQRNEIHQLKDKIEFLNSL